jgi:hypothetical protein
MSILSLWYMPKALLEKCKSTGGSNVCDYQRYKAKRSIEMGG